MKASVISALGLAAVATAWDKSTTSTVYTTSVYTVTSCAPEVTDCPAKMGSVTTDIISLYTTICPVTETETATSSAPITTETPWTTSTVYETKEYTILSCPPEVTNCPVGSKTSTVITSTTSCPVTTTAPPKSIETPWTTSTVYTTQEYTITSCPPEVTNCPVGSKTSTVLTLTTSCPVVSTTPASSIYTLPPPVSTSTWAAPPVSSWSKPAGLSSSPVLSTLTISTCVPSYITSVITVTASAAPSSSPVSSAPAAGCPGGSECPSVTTKPYGVASSTGSFPVPPKNTTTPYVFTGGAGSIKVGGAMMAVGLVAAML
ncbi:hypothetical protein EG329_001750 [Mollisiaceae sp. DMI_Dod_QoI]|nr:hypothetical protein EG329_001750 [Helotiales sp. DMI_Dod_QoI]